MILASTEKFLYAKSEKWDFGRKMAIERKQKLHAKSEEFLPKPSGYALFHLRFHFFRTSTFLRRFVIEKDFGKKVEVQFRSL